MGDYFVENQLELLDSPGEWYLDTSKNRLYLWPNTTAPMQDFVVIGATLESVVYANGTQDTPVANVSFHGIGFTQTAPTYMQPYERPISGESWRGAGSSVRVISIPLGAHAVEWFIVGALNQAI